MDYIKFSDNANSVISIVPQVTIDSNYLNQELYKNDVVRGTFTSQYPHLGIVSIRFRTYYRINNDKLIFRLREKGSGVWYYENSYNTDQFQPNTLFPFGFPIIDDSKGKKYEFEIESISGGYDNAVSVNSDRPFLVSKYKYAFKEILSNRLVFKEFFINKIKGLITDTDIVSYMLENIVICVVYFYLARSTYKNKHWMTFLVFSFIVISDIFFIQYYSNVVYLIALIAIIIMPFIMNECRDLLFNQTILLAIISFISSDSYRSMWSQKTNSWLLVSLIGLIASIMKKKK